MSRYRSIFLEPDWAHSAYYGWSDEWPDPRFRILKRRSGPLERRLIVSDLDEPQRAIALANQARLAAGPVAEIVIHDLKGLTDWKAQGYDPIGRDERMLNVDTFVIDLSRSEDELLASMSQQYRRRIRTAERRGLTVAAEANPSSVRLDEFFGQFAAMAEARGLRPPDRRALDRMFSDGRAMLFSVGRRSGAAANYVMTYRAGDKAIFLYGVAHAKTNDGAGHLTQWTAIRTLKSQGVRWYDLGGLSSLDEQDGLYRFKKGFGGQLVNLGGEYRVRTPLARLARNALSGARRLKQVVGA